jgi:hypothetical protein
MGLRLSDGNVIGERVHCLALARPPRTFTCVSVEYVCVVGGGEVCEYRGFAL